MVRYGNGNPPTHPPPPPGGKNGGDVVDLPWGRSRFSRLWPYGEAAQGAVPVIALSKGVVFGILYIKS